MIAAIPPNIDRIHRHEAYAHTSRRGKALMHARNWICDGEENSKLVPHVAKNNVSGETQKNNTLVNNSTCGIQDSCQGHVTAEEGYKCKLDG